jgi:YD repeat-containing protein
MASQSTTEYVKGGSLTANTTYCYVPPNCTEARFGDDEVADKKEYGYGGVLLRDTTYTYYAFEEPTQVIVKDGKGNWVAETDAYYDGQGASWSYNTALPTTPVTPPLPKGTHDETNYGPDSKLYRGNPTKVIRCLSGTGSTCAGPTTTYTFYETGQESTMTAPCGNASCTGDMSAGSQTTTYNYNDAPYTSKMAVPSGNSNAYLTGIVNPKNQTESFTYNYLTGQLMSSTDENTQTTNYTYDDPLLRLTQSSYPDTGSTTIAFDDSTPSVTTTTNQSPNPSRVSVAARDGMGHVIEMQSNPSLGVIDYVDTTFNGMGQVHTRSNPHWAASLPSDGVATFYYDAVGRKIEEKEQDGISLLKWCYNGVASYINVICNPQLGSYAGNATWVDSTDENGNQWQRSSDTFGRLVVVMEPNGTSHSSSLETDYSYDLENNLISVNQMGNSTTDNARGRGFIYDSLSRLTTATNPEIGTIGYQYDLNGNVLSKTAPAPSSPPGSSSTVTTNYFYDTLNRVLSKSYSNAIYATPASCFQYDVPITLSGSQTDQYPIGRLTLEWTQTASCPGGIQTALPTGALTATITGHDLMGRVIGEQQCVSATCANATPYALGYGYDLAGNLISATNPVGANGAPLGFTYNYDGAAHLAGIVSNWTANFPANLYTIAPFPSIGYGPAGPINWSLGTNLSVTQSYTNRLWVNSIVSNGRVP